MAKRTEIEDYAISRKIVVLMREGYPQDQATAIAFRMWRDGQLNIPRTPPVQKKSREQRRKEYFQKLADRNRRRM